MIKKTWNKIKSWFGLSLEVEESPKIEPSIPELTPEVIPEPEVESRDWPDFKSMTKLEIDIWARDELGLRLDRRYKKKTMINAIMNSVDSEKDK